MKRKRFSEEQIAFASRQAESGTTIEEICCKMGGLGADILSLEKSLRPHGCRRDPAPEAA